MAAFTKWADVLLLMDIDELSNRFDVSAVLHSNIEIPPEGLTLKSNNGACYQCRPIGNGYTTRLVAVGAEQSKPLDGAELDWQSGEVMEDAKNSFRARFPGASVRVFLLSELYSEWLESARLERDAKFLIACENRRAGDLEEAGKLSCEEFARVGASGLPGGWAIFMGRNAKKPLVESGPLSLPAEVRLELVGGIRYSDSRLSENEFFCFAPPIVKLQGCQQGECVMVGNMRLSQDPQNQEYWLLPKTLPEDTPLIINAEGPQPPYGGFVIVLRAPLATCSAATMPVLDKFGEVVPDCGGAGAHARGGVVEGVAPPATPAEGRKCISHSQSDMLRILQGMRNAKKKCPYCGKIFKPQSDEKRCAECDAEFIASRRSISSH